MSSRTRQRVAINSVIIKWTSRSGKILFPNSDKNGVFELTFTCRSRCSELPLKSPGSLAILALAALLLPVSPHALALFLALSIVGILGDDALRCSFNLTDVLPSFPTEVVGSSSVLPPLQAILPRMLVWGRSPRAPSTGGALHTGAPSQRSRSVPRMVVPHAPALLLALSTGPIISLLSGR